MDFQQTGGEMEGSGTATGTTEVGYVGQAQGITLIDTELGSGERYASTLRSAGNRATGTLLEEASAGTSRAEVRKRAQRKADKSIYWASEQCLSALEGAMANYENFAARMNSLYSAGEALQRVWQAAADREDCFKEIVNLLQGLLLGKKPERFVADQIKVMSWAVTKTIMASPVMPETVMEVMGELDRSKLGPFDLIE